MRTVFDTDDSGGAYDASLVDKVIRQRQPGRSSCTVDFPFLAEGDIDIPVTVETTVYTTCDADEQRGHFIDTEVVVTEIKLVNGSTVDEHDLSLLTGSPEDWITGEIVNAAIHYHEHPDELDGYTTGGDDE